MIVWTNDQWFALILFPATLDLRHLLSRRKIRWSLAAHDICFTNVWHSYFFMLGKCIPTVRGDGVYQEAINFCIEKLGCGDWVHVFPEGKVNMVKENIRFELLFFIMSSVKWNGNTKIGKNLDVIVNYRQNLIKVNFKIFYDYIILEI